MTVQRMDHVGVVVADLDGAIEFFIELGLELESRMHVADPWVDRVVGLDDVRVEIAMVQTPDGHSKLELTAFDHPVAVGSTPSPAVPNVLGLRRLMFAVDDIHATVARLEACGGELIGEVAQYEDVYLLCYLRGPEGIIIALAQQLS